MGVGGKPRRVFVDRLDQRAPCDPTLRSKLLIDLADDRSARELVANVSLRPAHLGLPVQETSCLDVKRPNPSVT
jgi:hypothetical protein